MKAYTLSSVSYLSFSSPTVWAVAFMAAFNGGGRKALKQRSFHSGSLPTKNPPQNRFDVVVDLLLQGVVAALIEAFGGSPRGGVNDLEQRHCTIKALS